MVVFTRRIIYVLELKLSNNGGVTAAEHQIKDRQYVEPFKADGRKVIALAVELDDMGKGLIDWKEVNQHECYVTIDFRFKYYTSLKPLLHGLREVFNYANF